MVSLPTTVDALVLGTKNFSNSGTNHDRDFAYMEFYFAYTTPSVAYIFDEVQLDGDEAGDIYTSDASNPDFSNFL